MCNHENIINKLTFQEHSLPAKLRSCRPHILSIYHMCVCVCVVLRKKAAPMLFQDLGLRGRTAPMLLPEWHKKWLKGGWWASVVKCIIAVCWRWCTIRVLGLICSVCKFERECDGHPRRTVYICQAKRSRYSRLLQHDNRMCCYKHNTFYSLNYNQPTAGSWIHNIFYFLNYI